ncbi:MAG TPA: hypothetical protein V6D43_25630 [Candidatus Sericytochromatia bacterium]
MLYPTWRYCWLAMPVLLSVFSSAVSVCARPASVFIPHLERIQSSLPKGLAMRLPSDIPLSGPSDIEESKLIVQSFPSETPQSFTVSLFTCDRSPLPCLLGSFSVESNTTESAKRELARHNAKGDRIALVKNVPGYLLEGPRQNPSYQFSTLMWQQNDMIYTISFPATERETIVFMATSMATEQPLYHRVSHSIPSF